MLSLLYGTIGLINIDQKHDVIDKIINSKDDLAEPELSLLETGDAELDRLGSLKSKRDLESNQNVRLTSRQDKKSQKLNNGEIITQRSAMMNEISRAISFS